MFSTNSGLTGNYLSATTSSFTEFTAEIAPQLLPKASTEVGPHGTTIVAASYPGGVVMAGDRRATVGSMIAQRDIEKVFGADEFSIVGIAGLAGLAFEIVRLFQVELQHYEKIEGSALSLDGKANRLGSMIRGNLDFALQGLVVLPIFAGWDDKVEAGRIFSYDATGGRYEENKFYAVGSGAPFARGSLKKTYQADGSETKTVVSLLQALSDAADDDSATSGPDTIRNIYPVVFSANKSGVHRYSTDKVRKLSEQVVMS